ncbi:MAG TPA: C39 family peptidase [Rectinemataceae bacterium]|nr:C39 family peptidase [Rectinemataceae bacterium]
MAILGTPYWNDRKRAYFRQENNSFEHMLRCSLSGGISPLETCGPTAALNCLTARGYEVGVRCPGLYRPQPEDVLTAFFNDPGNFAALRAAWPGLDPERLPGNEVAQWYPLAVREVFGKPCEFAGEMSFYEAMAHLANGRPLQVCLRKPGHFVALVAYDEEKEEFILNDSWGGRWPDGDGFNKRLSKAEYGANVKPLSLIYW